MQSIEASVKKVARPMERAVLLTNNHSAANGVWRNLGIALGREPPDSAAARDYRSMLEQVIKQNPGGVGLITIVQSTSTPTPDGRDAMVRMFRDLWPSLRGAAFVVQARGFSAATQRAVLSAFLMATRLGDRLKIFSTMESATPWLASVLQDGHKDLKGADLSNAMLDVVNEFCQRYQQPPAK